MIHDVDLKIIGSSQASEGEASPQHATVKISQRHPKTMVLKHIVALAAGTAQHCLLKSQETSSKCSSQVSKSK